MDDRPKKQRKTTKGTTTPVESWPRLCAGAEPPALVKLRESTFRTLWDQHEQRAQEIANYVDGKVLIDVHNYVNATEAPAGRLRTALVVSGPNHNGQRHLLEQLREDTEHSNNINIQLQAGQSPNLQSALKHVIRDVIEQQSGQEGYASFLASKKRLIPMNFDLELLEKYVKEKGLGKIIICFQDVETFDTGVLSEVLSTLASWTDRLSFVALLGVATTIELFESRLSKSVVRLLDTTAFDFSSMRDPLYEIFCSVQCNPQTKLYLGGMTVNSLYDLTQDQVALTSSSVHALKYIYMTHFFANPLSALLERRLPEKEDIAPLCESIRNTPSFQTHCEALLSQSKSPTKTVRQLLSNDDFLLGQAQSAVLTGIDTLRRINERVQHLVTLHQYLHPKEGSSLQLHAQLLNSLPSINESPAYETLIERFKLIKSDDLITLVFAHPSILPKLAGQSLSQLTTAISKLHTKHSISAISSVYSSQTLSATTKVSSDSSAEKEYTKILNDLLGKLATYFSPTSSSISIFVDPSTLFMNEAFLFNTRSPLLPTFVPRPRFAIERALSRPSDYLGCECCNDPTSLHDEVENGNAREATSVLYNLVNEAGREINVRDLWDTFRQVLSPPEDVDSGDEDGTADEEQENHLLGLFYQALANVKMLGLIKSSSATGTGANKKAVDVISRTTWKGL